MKRRFLLFAMAFVVALASSGAVFAYVSEVDARAVADQQPTKVLVVTERILAGTTAGQALENDQVEVKTVAKGSVPEGGLATVDDIADQVALADLFPGEMLLAAKFGAEPPPNSGALTIPPGMLAISVSLEDPQSVAGFVTPGAEVAVFDTFNVFPLAAASGQAPSGDRLSDDFDVNRATRLLLPRVKVLAVGTEAVAAGPEAGSDEEADVVAPVGVVALTLAVSQREAEKVILAAETGSLWFGLLSPDSKTAPSEGVDSRRLFGKGV